jgi:RNA polymerase sigma factor (sigma-70 family)
MTDPALLQWIRGLPVPPADGDAALIRRLRQGRDEGAFAAVVRRHGPMVWGVCSRLLGDAHAAEDAFQAVFLVFLRKAAGLRQPERLGPWLHGVACRTARHARRRALRRRERAADLDALPAAAAPAPAGDLRPVLDAAIQALPPRYRQPVILCYLEGLTYVQAGRQLGCPPGTVATRLSRARDRLRVLLTRQGVAVTAAGLAAALAETALARTLPRALLETTVSGAWGAVPASILVLMKGVCQGMLLEQGRIGLLIVAAVGLLGLGGLGAYRAAAGQEPHAAPVAEPPPLAPVAVAPVPTDTATAATHRTANFEVKATSARVAKLVAEEAERQRQRLAQLWFGKELPAWADPCLVKVEIIQGGSGGATTFVFEQGHVRRMEMHLQGPLEATLVNALPHEITHTLLANHFGRPVPRWADEGAAVMAEEETVQQRHQELARKKRRAGESLGMMRLFQLTEFPQDVMALYAEGYSVTRFLVDRRDRGRFLAFVWDGMERDWDTAVRLHYDFKSVEELESAWLWHLGSLSLDRSPSTPVYERFCDTLRREKAWQNSTANASLTVEKVQAGHLVGVRFKQRGDQDREDLTVTAAEASVEVSKDGQYLVVHFRDGAIARQGLTSATFNKLDITVPLEKTAAPPQAQPPAAGPLMPPPLDSGAERVMQALRRQLCFNPPRCPWAIYVRSVEGQELRQVTFLQRTAQGDDQVILKAAAGSLAVSKNGQYVTFTFRDGDVSKDGGTTFYYFQQEEFTVPLPPPDLPRLPAAATPIQSLHRPLVTVFARFDGTNLRLAAPTYYYQPVTTTAQGPGDDRPRPTTSYELKTAYREVVNLPQAGVQAYRIRNGKPAAMALAEALQGEPGPLGLAVLVAPDGRLPDDYQLQVFKEGTPLLLLPPATLPGSSPATPPTPAPAPPPPAAHLRR